MSLEIRATTTTTTTTTTTSTPANTYSKHFGSEADVVLPGHAEHIGQVQREVDDPPAGGRQVSPGEHGADQEALHDGHHGEGAQEEEDHPGVAVGQKVPFLWRDDRVSE